MTALDKLRSLGEKARGRIDKVYLHWTGGWHEPNAVDKADYHILINGEGDLLFMADDLTEAREHTFGRNSRAVAIALCCGVLGACDAKTGLMANSKAPYTAAQIESMAKAVAVLLPALGLDISIDTVLTHAEAADNLDGWMVDYSQLKGGRNGQPYGMYGPLHTFERWDLWKLVDYDGAIRGGGDILRGKAQYYRNKE
jgi:hypothetical protein